MNTTAIFFILSNSISSMDCIHQVISFQIMSQIEVSFANRNRNDSMTEHSFIDKML